MDNKDVIANALECPVPKKKPEDENRKLSTFSLPPDLVEEVRKRSQATDVPMSRLVERAIREFLRDGDDAV